MMNTTDRFAERLQELDVPPDRPELLKLLPVCFVAWSSGDLTPRQGRRLQRLARHYVRFDPGDAESFLARWLEIPPLPDRVVAACRLLHELAGAPDEPNVTFVGLAHLQVHAEWVVRAKPRVADSPYAVTPDEARALDSIGRWLGVDMGHSWSRVVHELDSVPRSWRAA